MAITASNGFFIGRKMKIQSLQKYLVQNEAQLLIITDEVNRRYFTDLRSTAGVLVVTPQNAFLIIDSRYIEVAQKICNIEVILQESNVWEQLKSILSSINLNVDHCILGESYINLAEYNKIKEILPTNCKFSNINLAEQRAIKSSDEIKYLKKAAKIADEAFAEMLNYVKAGKTENELRVILECEMLKRGSEGVSFETIVASGPRSSMPHGVASDKIIDIGDFITFDFGAIYNGYHSDMTRTIVVDQVSEKQQFLYQAVLEAQLKGLELVKAGTSCKEVDSEVRNVLAKYSLDKYFTHGLGHGVGLEIHEEPRLSPLSSSVLQENMIVTVEPGIYLENECGLRIEDTVVVTKDKCLVLNETSKDLLIVRNL